MQRDLNDCKAERENLEANVEKIEATLRRTNENLADCENRSRRSGQSKQTNLSATFVQEYTAEAKAANRVIVLTQKQPILRITVNGQYWYISR